VADRHEEIVRTWLTKDSTDFGYFQRFEAPELVNLFWSRSSRFRRSFEKWLDLTDTLEIACGAGRHAAQIVNQCGRLTLIDTSQDAVAIARERFAQNNNVTVVLSEDGLTLPFPERSFSTVYSYDAMVHFELLTMASYIKEIGRVLRPGGRAIIHHSNYGKNPSGKFDENPSWRNFMPSGLVVHLADRNGLRVLEHQVFPWNKRWFLKTDALTVLERP
jgi:ubiquinone/menaquinone biosynthesis C-methylase UbiE